MTKTRCCLLMKDLRIETLAGIYNDIHDSNGKIKPLYDTEVEYIRGYIAKKSDHEQVLFDIFLNKDLKYLVKKTNSNP